MQFGQIDKWQWVYLPDRSRKIKIKEFTYQVTQTAERRTQNMQVLYFSGSKTCFFFWSFWSLNWLGSFDPSASSWNRVIFNFHFILICTLRIEEFDFCGHSYTVEGKPTDPWWKKQNKERMYEWPHGVNIPIILLGTSNLSKNMFHSMTTNINHSIKFNNLGIILSRRRWFIRWSMPRFFNTKYQKSVVPFSFFIYYRYIFFWGVHLAWVPTASEFWWYDNALPHIVAPCKCVLEVDVLTLTNVVTAFPQM